MSGQGFTELSDEIDLLSTVYCKKLVSLVGYCQEGSNLILLYEYMWGGDMRQRLYGPKALRFPPNWSQRLYVAVDGGRGRLLMEVKRSCIQLTEKLDAKVADFGLSKLTDLEQTPCNDDVDLSDLDPEYNSTGLLTDKSDVYSFAVVLLELLSGQAPIVKEGSTTRSSRIRSRLP